MVSPLKLGKIGGLCSCAVHVSAVERAKTNAAIRRRLHLSRAASYFRKRRWHDDRDTAPRSAILAARLRLWLRRLCALFNLSKLSVCFPNVIAKGRLKLDDGFAYIEKMIQGHDWAVPGGYTIADPYLLFFYHVAQGFPVAERFPALTKVTERVMARPAVVRILAKEAALN